MADPVVKQPEQLLAMGGKFYAIAGVSWCDTPFDSWRLVPGLGYVRDDDPADYDDSD